MHTTSVISLFSHTQRWVKHLVKILRQGIGTYTRYLQKNPKHHVEIIVIGIIALCFWVNASYVSYPDEFVNVLGGRYILEGNIPYRDFFDHHAPLAWHLASVLLLFSFNSFVIFRLIWSTTVFALLLILGLHIRRQYRDMYPYYLGFFFIYPIMGVYFWFHLFLADSLAILFGSITLWMLMAQTLHNEMRWRWIVVTSITTWALVFSSLAFVYLAMVLYAWQMYLIGWKWKRLVRYALYASAPYVIYFVYIAVTGALYDFYYYNAVYNTKLYIDIPNYTRGSMFNPLKFALTLVFNFYENFFLLLTQVKLFDLYLPLRYMAALSSVTMFFLLLRRNIILAGLFFFVISFSAPRSNVQGSGEGDYQVAMFLMMGTIATFLVIYLTQRLKLTIQYLDDIKRITIVIICVFLFFTTLFLLKNTYGKWYKRYTQQLPGIQDVSDVGSFFNKVLKEDEYYWMGPYEPHQMFYVHEGQLPGKYIHLMPQFREDRRIRETFLEQFDQHPPTYIIFRQETSIFGTPALEFGEFFLNWMENDYTRLEHIENVEVLRNPSFFNFDTDLYIRNDMQEELLQRMKNHGYISY